MDGADIDTEDDDETADTEILDTVFTGRRNMWGRSRVNFRCESKDGLQVCNATNVLSDILSNYDSTHRPFAGENKKLCFFVT